MFILPLIITKKKGLKFISSIVAETQPLSQGAEQKHEERVLGEGEKNSFYHFARKRRAQQAKCLKECALHWEELRGVL